MVEKTNCWFLPLEMLLALILLCDFKYSLYRSRVKNSLFWKIYVVENWKHEETLVNLFNFTVKHLLKISTDNDGGARNHICICLTLAHPPINTWREGQQDFSDTISCHSRRVGGSPTKTNSGRKVTKAETKKERKCL
jgi:hypothetical protein